MVIRYNHAQDHWTHRIQAPLTYLQSFHNYPTSVPSKPHLYSTSSQYSLFIRRYHGVKLFYTVIVILAQPPSSSSLKTTDRSFRYASPCLWNQLPSSLRKPHSSTSSPISYSPIPSPITSSFSDSPLCTCTSITPSVFHSRLKTYLFHKSYTPRSRSFTSSSRTASTDLSLDRFFWATRFLILFFPYFSFLDRALD